MIADCCERHGIALLALETDEDHVHVFVYADTAGNVSAEVIRRYIEECQGK